MALSCCLSSRLCANLHRNLCQRATILPMGGCAKGGKIAVIADLPSRRGGLGALEHPSPRAVWCSCRPSFGRSGSLVGRQTIHYPRGDTLVTPTFPTVVEGLWLAIFPRRFKPPQAIAIHDDTAILNAPVTNMWLAMARHKSRKTTVSPHMRRRCVSDGGDRDCAQHLPWAGNRALHRGIGGWRNEMEPPQPSAAPPFVSVYRHKDACHAA